MTTIGNEILENIKQAMEEMDHEEQYELLIASKALALLSSMRAENPKLAG